MRQQYDPFGYPPTGTSLFGGDKERTTTAATSTFLSHDPAQPPPRLWQSERLTGKYAKEEFPPDLIFRPGPETTVSPAGLLQLGAGRGNSIPSVSAAARGMFGGKPPNGPGEDAQLLSSIQKLLTEGDARGGPTTVSGGFGLGSAPGSARGPGPAAPGGLLPGPSMPGAVAPPLFSHSSPALGHGMLLGGGLGPAGPQDTSAALPSVLQRDSSHPSLQSAYDMTQQFRYHRAY